jgi:hypothetical protein
MAIRKGQLTIFRCAWCDKVMVDGRSDKKFDSPLCRKRFSRWKQKIDKIDKQCKANLEVLNDYLNHFATREKAAKVTKGIELAAKRLLIENHVQDVQ